MHIEYFALACVALRRLALRVLLAALAALPPSHALAAIIDATAQNYRELLTKLKPGDTLRLAAGEYHRGLPIHNMRGTREAPIVIRGPSTGDPAVLVARAGANTVSIVDSAHVEIRDLTLDGRGILVDAVKAEGHARFAHHITLENLVIVNHGAHQAKVGISTKCPAWGWVIRGNRIHGAGTGMYLGNSNGHDPFYGGLIEYNVITDPIGYGIQIKHQHARPALDIAPRGRFVTVIRHNVLSKANGASSGPDARPNLLLGHWPLSGEGSTDEYLVYGNYLADNPHEALLQAEGNVAIYGNVLRNRHGPGMHIQPHNDIPRNVRILDNTIVTLGNPIVVRTNEATDATLQLVRGNAVFSPHPAAGGVQAENRTHPLEDVQSMLGSAWNDEAFDPFPSDDRLRCAAADAKTSSGLLDAGCDFNGNRRAASFCGAYAGFGVNPGWRPALTRKPRSLCRGP